MSDRNYYDTFEGFDLVEKYLTGDFYALPPAGLRHVGDYVGIHDDHYCKSDREVRMAVLAALRYEHEMEMERLAELAKSL